MVDARIPVSILTGFLGSGKTTLLRSLLRQPEMAGCAVIINEFGEIGLDHELVEAIDGETVLLPGGCVCCTVQDDLTKTLIKLRQRVLSGELEPLARIVIETTGLADPAPLMQLLVRDADLAAGFRLERVITTLDAVFGMQQLDTHPEAARQLAMADRVIVTKSDLANFAAPRRLIERIRQVLGEIDVLTARHGDIAAARVFASTAAGGGLPAGGAVSCAPGCIGQGCDHTIDHGIRSHSLVFDEPLAWDQVSDWLGSLAFFHGPRLLRIKGILNARGSANPIAIHGVRETIYPPTDLQAWSGEDRSTRIVLITQGLERDQVMPAFA